jgi:hypothetical protein
MSLDYYYHHVPRLSITFNDGRLMIIVGVAKLIVNVRVPLLREK